ncbi:hypothetical protein SAMN05216438_1301, partial [Lactococcus garvieae]
KKKKRAVCKNSENKKRVFIMINKEGGESLVRK